MCGIAIMAVLGGRLLTTALPGKPETTALASALTPITSPVGAQSLLYSTPIRIGVSFRRKWVKSSFI